jgi:hypothetical protein
MMIQAQMLKLSTSFYQIVVDLFIHSFIHSFIDGQSFQVLHRTSQYSPSLFRVAGWAMNHSNFFSFALVVVTILNAAGVDAHKLGICQATNFSTCQHLRRCDTQWHSGRWWYYWMTTCPPASVTSPSWSDLKSVLVSIPGHCSCSTNSAQDAKKLFVNVNFVDNQCKRVNINFVCVRQSFISDLWRCVQWRSEAMHLR